MAILTREKARVLCLAMLMNPILFIGITLFFTRYSLPVDPPYWSGKARIAALAISAYMIIAPFVLAAVLRKSSDQLRARGVDIDALIALTGIGSAMGPVMCGLFLFVLGDRLIFLQMGLLVSLFAMAYWCWRERLLLFPPQPPVIRTQDRQ